MNTKNSLKDTVDQNLSGSIKEPTKQYETTLFFHYIYCRLSAKFEVDLCHVNNIHVSPYTEKKTGFNPNATFIL